MSQPIPRGAPARRAVFQGRGLPQREPEHVLGPGPQPTPRDARERQARNAARPPARTTARRARGRAAARSKGQTKVWRAKDWSPPLLVGAHHSTDHGAVVGAYHIQAPFMHSAAKQGLGSQLRVATHPFSLLRRLHLPNGGVFVRAPRSRDSSPQRLRIPFLLRAPSQDEGKLCSPDRVAAFAATPVGIRFQSRGGHRTSPGRQSRCCRFHSASNVQDQSPMGHSLDFPLRRVQERVRRSGTPSQLHEEFVVGHSSAVPLTVSARRLRAPLQPSQSFCPVEPDSGRDGGPLSEG